MTQKKKSKTTARQKMDALKKMPTKAIIEELTRRGMSVEIDYQSVFAKVRTELHDLLIELRFNAEINEDEDEQWFDEVADELQTILDKMPDDSICDWEVVLQDVESRLEEVEDITDCYAICEIEDVADREEMRDVTRRIGNILFTIARNRSIDKYLAIEEMAGKVCY